MDDLLLPLATDAEPVVVAPTAQCALHVVGQMLYHLVHAQTFGYLVGNYEHSPVLDALIQLHALIRLGVCAETRTLAHDELPALTPWLALLPDDLRAILGGAIRAERSGQSCHRALMLPITPGFAAHLAAVGLPPLPPPTGRDAQD